jgi:hypothetical protein
VNLDELNSSIDEILNVFFKQKEQKTGEISKDVKEPHIRFKREDLSKMIQLSGSIINLKSTQVVPKSITIVYNDDGYRMIANNDLEYIEYKFNVLNEENRLVDTICLPIELIKSISNMMDDEIIIYKNEEGSYFIRLLLEGDLYLDLPTPEHSLLVRPFNDLELEGVSLVSQSHLLEALKALIPIVNDEVVLDRKRITFAKDRAYFISRKYFMDYTLPLPSMRVSLRFADVLKRMILSYNNSKSLKFWKDKDNDSRVAVTCEDVLFSSTVVRVEGESKATEYLDKVKDKKHLVVNLKDLDSVVSIACSLPYSKKEVRLTYTDALTVSIPMRTRTTEFKVPCTEVGKVNSRGDIVVPADSLKKLLDSFGSSESASLVILDSCVVIGKNNLLGVLEV